MKKQVYISVSTDPIQNSQDAIEYAKSLAGKGDFLHCDVMDGNFVPRHTYDFNVVENINKHCASMLDVHLMVKEPLDLIDEYINAGANILTVHYEAFNDLENLHKALKKIRKRGVLAGLAFNPGTRVDDIKIFCFNVDVVLVMGVEPGASGQKFLNGVVEKIRELDKFRNDNDLSFKIEVDGGVNADNAQLLVDAGADMLVSGNFIYKSLDRGLAIEILKGNKL